jgi:hypothetical protein
MTPCSHTRQTVVGAAPGPGKAQFLALCFSFVLTLVRSLSQLGKVEAGNKRSHQKITSEQFAEHLGGSIHPFNHSLCLSDCRQPDPGWVDGGSSEYPSKPGI